MSPGATEHAATKLSDEDDATDQPSGSDTAKTVTCAASQVSFLLLSSQFWLMLSMSRGVINGVKQFLSHPPSRIKWVDQWAVDRDPVLTSTSSAKIGKTAIPS